MKTRRFARKINLVILAIIFAFTGILLNAQKSGALEAVSIDLEAAIEEDDSSGSGSLFFGQNHYYSVVLRGNGEAIVYGKLVTTNFTEETMKTYKFSLPAIHPYEMTIYQMELPQECAEYDFKRACLKYVDPDYTNGSRLYYYDGSSVASYTKAKYQRSEDNTFLVELPKEVAPNKTTALIISYATKDYVTKGLSTFKYNFETAEVDSRIKEVSVAIDVDSDLVLRGRPSQVNYDSSASIKNELDSGSSLESRDLDRVQHQIGRAGILVKEANDLAPYETLSVSGEYAQNWFLLNLTRLIWIVVGLAILIVSILCAVKFYRKSRANKAKVVKKTTLSSDKPQPKQTKNEPVVSEPVNPIFSRRNILSGLVGAIASSAVLLATPFLASWQSPARSYVDGYEVSPILSFPLLAMKISLAVIAFFTAILYPAIRAAMKSGRKSFLHVIGLELLWLTILVIIFSVVILVFHAGVATNPSSSWDILYR